MPPTTDLSFGERFYLREAIKGMGVIARHFWRNLFGYRDPNPDVLERKGPGVNLVTTINYPEERQEYPPGVPPAVRGEPAQPALPGHRAGTEVGWLMVGQPNRISSTARPAGLNI